MAPTAAEISNRPFSIPRGEVIAPNTAKPVPVKTNIHTKRCNRWPDNLRFLLTTSARCHGNYGRGAGVGRGLAVGSGLAVGVGLGVEVGVGVAVGVCVAVGVGVGVGVGVTTWINSIRPPLPN